MTMVFWIPMQLWGSARPDERDKLGASHAGVKVSPYVLVTA